MNHVHIGPSPLAHGLLIPATLAAGFSVFLIGRPGASGSTEYVEIDTRTGEKKMHEVAAFEGPPALTDASMELRSRIGRGEPLLITSTLRDAIVPRRHLVAEILKARPKGAETLFATCENSPHPIYREIEDACADAGAVALRTVVDRMCREEEELDEQGRRVILAHPVGEWLFEAPHKPLPLLEALCAAGGAKAVENYVAHRDRKLWMVNGTHQALALLARVAPVGRYEIDAENLNKAARRSRTIVRISHLHGPMDEALRRLHPTLTGNLQFGMERALAYTEHPDKASRVLSGLKRQDLGPFIVSMDERLGQPARVCFQAGCSVEAFSVVLDAFEAVASDPGAFGDAPEIRRDPDLISDTTDLRAVEAYKRFIGSWMSDVEAQQRVERFATALRKSSPS
jgi:hypothetical protein